MTRFVLVRHGQTVWNRENRFRGQSNPELDAVGLKQAVATGRYVAARWSPVAVYASPLRRTMQTGHVIARIQGLSVQPLDGLLDMSFGEWQGLKFEDVSQRDPDRLRAWMKVPHTVRFPGGESLDEARGRVVPAMHRIAARHQGKTVALVSHTVINRVLLCAVLGLTNEGFWRLGQDTCAVNVFDVDEDGTSTMLLLNDTSHLHGLDR